MAGQMGKGFDELMKRIRRPAMAEPTVTPLLGDEHVEAACRARWPQHWDGFSECTRDNEREYMIAAIAAYQRSRMGGAS